MKKILLLVIILTSCSSILFAQKSDPYLKNFYPPELVIQFKNEINLTDEQETYIRDQYDQVITKYNQVNLDLRSEIQTMLGLISKHQINEEMALKQMSIVMELENRIKLMRLKLYVQIKNKLTTEQIKLLDGFKQKLEDR